MKNFSAVHFSLALLATLSALGCGKVITFGGSTSQVSNLLTAFPLVCKAYDLNTARMGSMPAQAAVASGGGFPSMIPPEPYATYLGSFTISHFNLPAMDENLGIPGTPDTFRKLVRNFAISCEAQIKVDQDTTYTFLTTNDSPTFVSVDGEFVNPFYVMSGDYVQGGQVALTAGLHTFRLEYLRIRCGCSEMERAFAARPSAQARPGVASALPGPNQIALQLFWGTNPSPTPTWTPTPSPTWTPTSLQIQSVQPVMTIPANAEIIPPSAFVAN